MKEPNICIKYFTVHLNNLSQKIEYVGEEFSLLSALKSFHSFLSTFRLVETKCMFKNLLVWKLHRVEQISKNYQNQNTQSKESFEDY